MTKDDVSSYRGTAPYIFISYSHADTDRVVPIITRLQTDGYRIWFDEGIEAGREWAVNIVDHLNTSTCVVAFLTQNYLISENCMDEIEHAKNKKIPTLIIYLDDIDIPDWFAMRHGRTQAIFCSHYETEEKLFSRIYEATILQKCLKDSCDPELVIEDGVLTEYKGTAEYVVVPDGVTAIGDCVFWQNESLKEIHLPEGVAHIGNAAFCACENLETINFPKSLLYIGKDAFFACEKLNRIDLPNNLTTISENAFGSCINIQDLHIPKRLHQLSSDSFHGCTKLKTITLDDESEVFDLYDGCLYDILMKKLYIVPGTKKSVTFPDGIKEIGRAFSGNDLIETILLPDSIESIENGAFSGCVNIKSISLGKNILSIGTHAFSNCERLMSITVSAENPIYRSEGDCCIRRIDNVLLFGCMNSIIPDGITEIADAAFYGCSWLTDIDLPDSIIKIGKSAFYESGLTHVAIPKHVESIDSCAFDNCDALTYIIIPNSVKYVGDRAFTGSDYTFEERYICCEAGQKPERWHREWTDDDSNVYWKDEWNYDESGNPVVQ